MLRSRFDADSGWRRVDIKNDFGYKKNSAAN